MKRSELRQIIKEEIQKLNEMGPDDFIAFLEDEIKKCEKTIKDYKKNRPGDRNIQFFKDSLDHMQATLRIAKKQREIG